METMFYREYALAPVEPVMELCLVRLSAGLGHQWRLHYPKLLMPPGFAGRARAVPGVL